MQQQKRVLFTVLDWGLGHATRSIPVIEALLKCGFDVQLAGEGNSLLLLKIISKTKNTRLIRYSSAFY